MTPPDAIRILEQHLRTIRSAELGNAIRLAIAALHDDVPTAMREVLDATGRTARDKHVPLGMRNDWSCCVIDQGVMVLRGPDTLSRGEAKRWVVEHYVT